MKTLIPILAGTLIALGSVFGSSVEVGNQNNHVQWVANALTEMESIKVGMTRKDVFRVFTTEGGIASPVHQRFVYKHCPLFKVQVEFQTRKSEEGRAIESDDDRIVNISKPFLERTIVD